MNSRWNEAEARALRGDLERRVYSSRLLGQEPSLVLHGGGNTSVKITERDLLGEQEEILYVKGSGRDLASIEPSGFSPVRLRHLLRLADLESLSDPDMVNELRAHMTQASAPTPSVEAILHAILPHKFVDHTHADAVLAITNTPDGSSRIRAVYGDRVVVVPYVMPGFELARACNELYAADAHDRTVGMVLMNHGIFSFGATARESYERMIDLVSRAESYLAEHTAPVARDAAGASPDRDIRSALAELRHSVSSFAGRPVVVSCHRDPVSRAFLRRPDLERIALQGPATPDHVIRTKRLPLIGRDVAGYARSYREYFDTHAARHRRRLTMLDPAPRVILDRELGICTVGATAAEGAVVFDLYRHTIGIIDDATGLGGYTALSASEIFDVEYWDLEQAKLARAPDRKPFTGEVGLVTGAASGIGRATVMSLLARGAAVIGLDLNAGVENMVPETTFLGIACDVTEPDRVRGALERGVREFGGLDMLILSAGIFPASAEVAALANDAWRRVMEVNLDANLTLLREAHPLLKLAPRYGRVVFIGSKNVAAPGPGAAAYSASKAALTQLARVTALEWGKDRIRVNSVHPNAVFDTGIWTEEILQSRARQYGLSVEAYRRRNLLGVELTSRDVGEVAAEMCGPLFAKTTGAQLPIDGGDERII